MRPRRIIVTGASGVGKTTLVEELAPLLDLAVIPELGRRICQQMGYKTIGEIPDQEAFKETVLDAQIEIEDSLGDYIADRSTIDCWALWERWNINTAMTFRSEAYYQKCLARALLYTDVIYIAPAFAPPQDGFRWCDPDYQKQVDRIVKQTLFIFGLWEKAIKIETDDFNERVSMVMEALAQ
jgi:predicted ATPase